MRTTSGTTLPCLLLLCGLAAAATVVPAWAQHAVPTGHPRLLGSLARLQQLAAERPADYARMADVARNRTAGDWEKTVSMALVGAIENDAVLCRDAVLKALDYVDGPIRQGHVPFGSDLAICAVAYDLCYNAWTAEERLRFHAYLNATVDANVNSETHVFHNGWYGYKHWGIGLACYASYYENARSQAILAGLRGEYLARAAPALELAGLGGGWAEGYYVHYWSYEWVFFCESARHCEGIDYYEDAPGFFRNRAVTGMFEMYPGIAIYNSRRPIPMGDGGGRVFGGDRDKTLCVRRILASRYRDDPAHQVVHAFNETTPRSSVGVYAYKNFLWRDTTVAEGELADFKLSHLSPGPGYVYARSSWDEDATYFFFKCGDRFASHQHLDVGHFLIYKHEELAGDGGHYDAFGSSHDVNYHLRTIAHNTILVHDPSEQWLGATSYDASIRAGPVSGNDGGQMHSWPHHNGAVADAAAWEAGRELYDIADILAFEDKGTYLYVAGDCSRAYSTNKLEYFTRQIVFIRPGTFVIFDRVKSRDRDFKKTWLLQAMKPPVTQAHGLTIRNGEGRLFVRTLLPRDAEVVLAAGDDLYTYGGQSYPPSRDTGPAPECRVEISPSAPADVDYFLHVLTAADAAVTSPPPASVREQPGVIGVTVDNTTVTFATAQPAGCIDMNGRRSGFPGDMDRDGMPDGWEMLHFGTIEASAGRLDQDFDGDRLCDLHEYRAGTDPTNARSVFALESIDVSPPGDAAVLQWASASNKSYTVWGASHVTQDWDYAVSSGIPARPPLNTLTAAVGRATRQAYRVTLDETP
ncbi:heparinase II/III family protein [Verrucomicrobiota bacterium]